MAYTSWTHSPSEADTSEQVIGVTEDTTSTVLFATVQNTGAEAATFEILYEKENHEYTVHAGSLGAIGAADSGEQIQLKIIVPYGCSLHAKASSTDVDFVFIGEEFADPAISWTGIQFLSQGSLLTRNFEAGSEIIDATTGKYFVILPDGTYTTCEYKPYTVLSPVKSRPIIGLGTYGVAVIKPDGTVWSAGNSSEDVALDTSSFQNVSSLWFRYENLFCVTESGNVYCSGEHSGLVENLSQVRKILPSDTGAVIALHTNGTISIVQDHQTISYSLSASIEELENVLDISSTSRGFYVLQADGTVTLFEYSWIENTTNQNFVELSNFSSGGTYGISEDRTFGSWEDLVIMFGDVVLCLALKDDGTLYFSGSSSPVSAVSGWSGEFVAIATKDADACAIKTDGSTVSYYNDQTPSFAPAWSAFNLFE
jgi:hypothetical protein